MKQRDGGNATAMWGELRLSDSGGLLQKLQPTGRPFAGRLVSSFSVFRRLVDTPPPVKARCVCVGGGGGRDPSHIPRSVRKTNMHCMSRFVCNKEHVSCVTIIRKTKKVGAGRRGEPVSDLSACGPTLGSPGDDTAITPILLSVGGPVMRSEVIDVSGPVMQSELMLMDLSCNQN